jgi:serine/threonine protein kinase
MPAPTTTDEFLELVRKSGVVEEKRLSAYVGKLRAAGPVPSPPAVLAGILVRDAILTHFQAENVLQGKWRRFTIGKYKVLERLGAGGMGQVFLCEHKLMRRRVAVKVLPTAKADDPSSLERFYREARCVAALDHPNIVRAYDIDQDEKLHFLVMEYVDGSSLQEIIKKVGPLSVERAAHYLRQSAVGLQHAHDSAGLVHRDIKPGNILIDRTGVVKILDMGLARFFHDEEDILTKKYDENVLGTADYLAPEQALDSHGVDIRADIYSLGATFYFCLTGKTPFTDGTVAQKLIWHQTRQPKSIRQIRTEVPEELASLIERMMAKDPAQRPQTPHEVAEALAPFTQTPIGPPPEEEMPRLSPAALGLTASDSNSAVPTAAASSGAPSSGHRKNWQVPSSGSSRPAPNSPAPRPNSPSSASPASPPPKLSRPTPPPSGRGTIAPTVAAPTKAAAPQARRTTTPQPQPAAEEEGVVWERLAPDTVESARANTPPSQTRKRPSSALHRALGPETLVQRQRRRVILVVSIVSAVILGGFAVAAIWATVRDKPAQGAPTGPQPRASLRVGPNAEFVTVAQAVRNALPGDHIVVNGPSHSEELILDGKASPSLKKLTIESEGDPVLWRAPQNRTAPVCLVILRNVDGLRLKGFTFDGEDRCPNTVQVVGQCPGTELQNLTISGFTGSGLVLMNCEGESNRPLLISHVQVTGSDKAKSAGLEFALDPADRNPKNRFIQFTDFVVKVRPPAVPILNRDKNADPANVKGLN